MTALRLIGYWASEHSGGWPDATQFVDDTWDEDERELVSSYVARGTIARACMGYSPCRFCGVNNGALEYTDGVFIWPEGLAHYLDEHAVRLPEEFVRHVLNRMDAIEEADVDQSWYRAQERP